MRSDSETNVAIVRRPAYFTASSNNLVCLGTYPCGAWNTGFDDNTFGAFKNVRQGIEWTLRSGRTPSSNTGPSDDVSGGGRHHCRSHFVSFKSKSIFSGYYAYIETSFLVSTGLNAWLVSPRFQPSSSPCKCHIEFYYHMYGTTIRNLTVYVREEATQWRRSQVWTMAGSQGNQWKKGMACINATSNYDVSNLF